jgi:PleD family two-component response regulator
VTLSIGIAVGEEGETLDGLMERADKALYTAKRGGRNRVEIATRQPTNN